jgi:hypothetical protein
LPRGAAPTEDTSELVGAEECGGRSRREGPKHHRNRHQSTAAGDGIDKARGEGGEGDRGDFKHWESVRGREVLRIPGVRCCPGKLPQPAVDFDDILGSLKADFRVFRR